MPSTKERIVKQAKEIFNQNGYNNVSLRNIADACGITIGNLNYHFKKKEDLVMEIQSEIYDNFYKVLTENTNYSLEDVINKFQLVSNNQKEYRYYFNNILELADAFPEVKNSQIKFRESLFSYYTKCFIKLCDEGIFRNDINEGQYKNLAFNIIIQHTLWYQNGSPIYDEAFKKFDFINYLYSTIYPYMTEAGKEEFKEIINRRK